MKFTPTKYAVMYHGERHPVGVTFDIDPVDAEEMAAHGTVEAETPKASPAPQREPEVKAAAQTTKKPGRPKSK